LQRFALEGTTVGMRRWRGFPNLRWLIHQDGLRHEWLEGQWHDLIVTIADRRLFAGSAGTLGMGVYVLDAKPLTVSPFFTFLYLDLLLGTLCDGSGDMLE
jgi:hypothetical protein